MHGSEDVNVHVSAAGYVGCLAFTVVFLVFFSLAVWRAATFRECTQDAQCHGTSTCGQDGMCVCDFDYGAWRPHFCDPTYATRRNDVPYLAFLIVCIVSLPLAWLSLVLCEA